MTKPHKTISPAGRLLQLVFAPRISGVCRVCGCTMTNPCYNPRNGACWWWDAKETLCSHCAIRHIFNDPRTKHCING